MDIKSLISNLKKTSPNNDSKTKKYIRIFSLLSIKLIICFFLLKSAFAKVDFSALSKIFHIQSLDNIFVIAILILSNWIVQIFRFHFLLQDNGIQINIINTTKAYFCGYSFKLLIPGGYAEFMKIFFISGKKQLSFGAFGVETALLGFLQIFFSALAGRYLFPEYEFIFILIAIISFAGLVFFPMFKKINRIRTLFQANIFNYRLVIRTVLLSLISLIIINTQYFYIIHLDADISWFQTAAVVLFIMGSGIVPFTFAGLGIRENLAIYLFGMFSLSAELGVSLTLFIFITNIVIPAMIGIFFILAHKADLKSSLNFSFRRPKSKTTS